MSSFAQDYLKEKIVMTVDDEGLLLKIFQRYFSYCSSHISPAINIRHIPISTGRSIKRCRQVISVQKINQKEEKH
jgi:hypothetical protein